MRESRAVGALRLWVLVWFIATLAAAAASPVLSPQRLTSVCSSDGAIVLPQQDDDGSLRTSAMGMDCPLCLVAGAPPRTHAPLRMAAPAFKAVPLLEDTVIFETSAAALPPRGPPSLS